MTIDRVIYFTIEYQNSSTFSKALAHVHFQLYAPQYRKIAGVRRGGGILLQTTTTYQTLASSSRAPRYPWLQACHVTVRTDF